MKTHLKSKNIVLKLRRAVRHGHSIYVSLPIEFVRKNNIEPGDDLVVIASNTTVQIMKPR